MLPSWHPARFLIWWSSRFIVVFDPGFIVLLWRRVRSCGNVYKAPGSPFCLLMLQFKVLRQSLSIALTHTHFRTESACLHLLLFFFFFYSGASDRKVRLYFISCVVYFLALFPGSLRGFRLRFLTICIRRINISSGRRCSQTVKHHRPPDVRFLPSSPPLPFLKREGELKTSVTHSLQAS